MKAILLILFYVGIVLSGVAILPKLIVNPKEEKLYKRSSWALFATGQMLVTPYATFNLLTESGILWKFIFAVVLLAGLIAVFSLTSHSKEK